MMRNNVLKEFLGMLPALLFMAYILVSMLRPFLGI